MTTAQFRSTLEDLVDALYSEAGVDPLTLDSLAGLAEALLGDNCFEHCGEIPELFWDTPADQWIIRLPDALSPAWSTWHTAQMLAEWVLRRTDPHPRVGMVHELAVRIAMPERAINHLRYQQGWSDEDIADFFLVPFSIAKRRLEESPGAIVRIGGRLSA